ncbi:SMP-30/gluconolactonase/LRE family protein [Jannaschia sp. LMIT008]|uniref:SMP-30/gluconolactonase/LRE family protein n=1 Tax=Jannaschia maritima TaxID=3032585 RepID=UPI002810D938|nr:SMP-30/gluconolactonase/LRE family protein [Jannaschia sp. LMIT008]
MTIDVRDPRMRDLIAPDATLDRIATGFGFTEGPVWHPGEGWLMFSDIARSVQHRWTPDGALSVFRTPSNQANGNCLDREGRIVTCEHAASRLVRHEHDGKLVRPLATHWNGRELNSPNDVICDTRGRIWFTDPTYGRIRPDLGLVRDPEQDASGVYRLDPDGTLARVADDHEQPNGLCLSADERTLWVNDTPRGHVRAWDVAPDGTLAGGAVWAEVRGEGKGAVDGMKVTACGHMLVNGPGGVHVHALSDARSLGVIRTPEMSTNFCLGGPDRTTLFVTATTSVYRIATRLRGLPMIPGRAP